MIELEHVLVVGALLFSVGLYVALSRRNAVGILMGVELMLNAVNLNLIGFARFVESPRPIDRPRLRRLRHHRRRRRGRGRPRARRLRLPPARLDRRRPPRFPEMVSARVD